MRPTLDFILHGAAGYAAIKPSPNSAITGAETLVSKSNCSIRRRAAPDPQASGVVGDRLVGNAHLVQVGNRGHVDAPLVVRGQPTPLDCLTEAARGSRTNDTSSIEPLQPRTGKVHPARCTVSWHV